MPLRVAIDLAVGGQGGVTDYTSFESFGREYLESELASLFGPDVHVSPARVGPFREKQGGVRFLFVAIRGNGQTFVDDSLLDQFHARLNSRLAGKDVERKFGAKVMGTRVATVPDGIEDPGFDPFEDPPPSVIEVVFSPDLEPYQVLGALTALSDYFRACGGAGFEPSFEFQETEVPVHA